MWWIRVPTCLPWVCVKIILKTQCALHCEPDDRVECSFIHLRHQRSWVRFSDKTFLKTWKTCRKWDIPCHFSRLGFLIQQPILFLDLFSWHYLGDPSFSFEKQSVVTMFNCRKLDDNPHFGTHDDRTNLAIIDIDTIEYMTKKLMLSMCFHPSN